MTGDGRRDSGIVDPRVDPIRVLFLEDDHAFVQMYRVLLEAQGCLVDVVAEGRAGLEAIREERPDLVFLDVRTPGMGGLDVLRALRADPETADLPVVVLTNYDDPAMMDEALRLGALQWMIKAHTTPRTLVDRMDGWLRVEDGDERTG